MTKFGCFFYNSLAYILAQYDRGCDLKVHFIYNYYEIQDLIKPLHNRKHL